MKAQIALFQNHPACSRQCCNGMITALKNDFHISIFGVKDDLDQVLAGKHMVAFPGGIGDASLYHKFFRRRNVDKIVDFVQNGGKYLGICMGAYWAGKNYFDLLDNNIDAVQYIKRPDAEVKRPYSTTVNVNWLNQEHDMFFYDGCTYTGDTSKFTTISTYANGEPMAIMQHNLGLIGCHPESEANWYDKPYLRDRWHKGVHHELLRDFVVQLHKN